MVAVAPTPHFRRAKLWLFLLVSLALSSPRISWAQTSQKCRKCLNRCKKQVKHCKRMSTNPLCRTPGMGSVCKMFKKAQCPAAGHICRKVSCELDVCRTPPDDKPPSKPMTGEPHILTFDDLRYDFQAVGEFVAARSKPSDFEVQVRLRAYNRATSVISMVAVRAGERVVAVAPDGAVTTRRVGESSWQPLDAGRLEGAGYAYEPRLAVKKLGRRYFILDGDNVVEVRPRTSHIDLYVAPAPGTEGSWVGLYGDFDGNAADDLKGRDGKANPVGDLSRDVLYTRFGNSWRLPQNESVLPYGKGETTKTFTDLSHPKERFDLASQSEAAKAKARATCLAAGVPEGRRLENCVYDILATGSEEFIVSYVPPKVRTTAKVTEVTEEATKTDGASVTAPKSVRGAAAFEVDWKGPLGKGDYVSLAKPEDEAGSHLRYLWVGRERRTMRAPAKPGTYELRYVLDDGGKRRILARTKLVVTEPVASVASAADTTVGRGIVVRWTGPGATGDYIDVMQKKDAAKGITHVAYAWVQDAKEVTIRGLAEPGDYVVRYIADAADGLTVLASTPVRITDVATTLEAPATAKVNSKLDVEWTGAGSRGDYISIAKVGTSNAGDYSTYTYVRPVGKSSGTVSVRAPEAAGRYELLYILSGAKKRRIVARRAIRIVP